MSRVFGISFLLVCTLAAPGAAWAQAALAGAVRDTSGALLPGVTVEAASPVLIEKVRSATTDGSGRYRIEDFRPGLYTVTFTLSGFTTVRREMLEVSGSAVITLDAEMRVGGVQETITVTGETPVVDVQNSTRVQRVLDDEVLAALPASRGYGNLLAAVSEATGASIDPVWLSVDTMRAHGIDPEDFPLWNQDRNGIEATFAIDSSRAFGSGLRCRPLVDTIRDTLAWRTPRLGDMPLKVGPSPERDRELVSLVRG